MQKDRFLILLFIIGSIFNTYSQAPMPAKSAGELAMDLKHMQVLGSVLYIAAHPDDENTSLISYLAGERGLRTAYLSLTRGDGGQNLLGEEKGSALGILRTQELLAARRVDGGEQMFSRAIDFGYSKTPEETQAFWDREKILGDVVWAIRKFRPDVIITRFAGPARGGGGHGHHTTSAILAREAFSLAADPNAFPDQLQYVKTWQPKRLFWNLYTWRRYEPDAKDAPRIVNLEIDTYNPFLGKGYGEISSEARSMHKGQGFGVFKRRGGIKERLLLLEGSMPDSSDIMEGIDISWNRLVGARSIQTALEDAFEMFHPSRPYEIVPKLLDAYQLLRGREEEIAQYKLEKLKKLIAYCAGLYFEINSDQFSAANGDTIRLTASITKRSPVEVSLDHINFPESDHALEVGKILGKDLVQFKSNFLAKDLPVSQPYWLERPGKAGIFDVREQSWIGLPENPPALEAAFALVFKNGTQNIPIVFGSPVVYKYVDPAKGEIYRPFIISPPVTININEQVSLFADKQAKTISMIAKSHMDNGGESKLRFSVPEGWRIEPEEILVSFDRKFQEKILQVSVSPPSYASKGSFSVEALSVNDTSSYGFQEINYDHFPTQTIFPPSTSELVKLNIQRAGNRIAYIEGAGDQVAESLEQIGYQVEILGEEEIVYDKLRQYDAVILGIRAYNSHPRLLNLKEELFNYAYQGGTLITQYTTIPRNRTMNIAPYPMNISRDRVSDETAMMKILDPDHPVLNFPNDIDQTDFEGWVQERGLYFPNKWDEVFTPVFESNDPGESPKKGALLIAKHGKGYFIYTGIAFFRQLPAGVPGAFRLMANLISIGKEPIDGK